jgi:hypothetical protein
VLIETEYGEYGRNATGRKFANPEGRNTNSKSGSHGGYWNAYGKCG